MKPLQQSISVATAKDAQPLAAMRTVVAQDMQRQFGEGAWSSIPSKAEVLKQIRASRVLVARFDEEIVGTVRLTPANLGVVDSSSFTPVSAALYVLGLAVAPHARRRGVGRRLLEAAKTALVRWPAQALWLDAYDNAAGAGPYYRQCGFREVGRTTFNGLPLIWFEWLAPVVGSKIISQMFTPP